MLDVYDKLPVCHDLNNGKFRTTDVLLNERVKFSTLLLHQQIQNGLSKCGYAYLSPIQQTALPLALTGTSLIAHAKSGTGKTLIYLLTALNNFLKHKPNHLQCLILSPTREIAKQVYDVFKNVGCFIEDLKVEYFIGGTPVDIDVIKCKNCHIAIGAPGRIKHLMHLGDLRTDQLQLLVLDEVDALLNHKEFAISELVSYLPKSKQIIVCTATFSKNIRDLLKPIVVNIKYVTVEKTETDDITSISNVLIGIKQYIASVPQDCTSLDTNRKRNKLIQILRNFEYEQCFIFVNYISLVKSVCNLLASYNLSALWISSEQTQSARINALNQLKLNKYRILVTTDLAARGIDVHNVNLVINLGVPCPADVYIHRMGRAGRYGSEGSVITILHEGEEIEQFKKIVSVISTEPVDLLVLPSEIDKNVSERNFEIIRCIPQQDIAIDNECYFKKHMKDHRNTTPTTKKKKNKNKKNKNFVDDNYGKEKNAFSENCAEAKICISPVTDDSSKTEKIESIIASFIQNVKEQMECKTNSITFDLLASMFVPETQPSDGICLKTDFENENEINQENVNGCKMFVEPVDESIMQYVKIIKEKNQYLDKQKIPCRIYEICDMLQNNNNILRGKSGNLPELIKDLLNKIRKLVLLIPEPESIRNEKIISGNLEKSVKKSKEIFKRFRLSDESLDQVERSGNTDDEKNDSGGSNSTKHSSKRSKYFHETKSKANAVVVPEANTNILTKVCGESDFNKINNFASVTNCKQVKKNAKNVSSSTNIDSLKFTTKNDTLIHLNRNIRSRSYSRNVVPSNSLNNNIPTRIDLTNNVLTCPNCKFKFTPPNITNQYIPILKPLRMFVDHTVERNIWSHHFTFINEQVQSLSSVNQFS